MSFNYHQLSRITKLSLIYFIISSAFYSQKSESGVVFGQADAPKLFLAQDQSFSKQIKHFLNHLIKASSAECARIFGKYQATIAREIDIEKLYFVSYKEVEDLLNQAVKESIDSLTLFTLPLLQDQKGFAIVFNEELLQRINENFNFHGLFNISIPSVEDGSAVRMKFLVIGQGKFIAGYDRNAKIKHPDYNFATGMYDYRELFIMAAKKDSKGNRGLFNIKALSKPNGKRKWMQGPLNVDIHSLIIISDRGGHGQILIQYDLFGIKHKIIDPIPIEKLYNESNRKDTGENKARKHLIANCSRIQTCGQYFALHRQPFLPV